MQPPTDPTDPRSQGPHGQQTGQGDQPQGRGQGGQSPPGAPPGGAQPAGYQTSGQQPTGGGQGPQQPGQPATGQSLSAPGQPGGVQPSWEQPGQAGAGGGRAPQGRSPTTGTHVPAPADQQVRTPTLRWVTITDPSHAVPIGPDDWVIDSRFDTQTGKWDLLVVVKPTDPDDAEEESDEES